MAIKRLSLQGQGAIFVDPAVAIVIPTTAASTVADVEITVADAAVGDAVIVNLIAALMEVDLVVAGAYVSEAGKIKVRLFNKDSGNAFTGGTSTCSVVLIRQ